MRVLEEGLGTATLALQARAGSIFVGSAPDSLRCVAAVGPGATELLRRGTPPHAALAGQALSRKSPFLVREVEPDPQFCNGTSIRTKLALLGSMVDGSRPLGVLQIVNPENPSKVGAHELRLAAGLGRSIAISLIQTTSLRRHEGLAARDPLTGLRNIRELHVELTRALKAARRRDHDMALMFVDVDHLKRINSRLGHAAGSEALRRTARALGQAVTEVGSVFRFGGDEFVVIQRRGSKESALALANHLRSHVAANTAGSIRNGGELPRITVSVGVATLKGLKRGPRSRPLELRARLMTTADRALFRAKAAGRNRVVLATRRDDRL